MMPFTRFGPTRQWLRSGIALLALSVGLAASPCAHATAPPPVRAANWTLSSAADWQAVALDGLIVVASDRGDAALTLDDGRPEGHFTSPVYAAPFPFTAAALFWTADTQDGAGLAVKVRLSQDGLAWSPWYPIYHPETQSDGRTYGENIVAMDGARFVQVRAVLTALSGAHSPRLDDLTVLLIDASHAPTLAQALADSAAVRSAALERPPLISRQAWGADPSYLDWDPEYAPVERMVLHHTVTAGGSNPVAEVQAIYYYHAVTRGWGDIGYNYMVDRYGNLYEGRYGGDDVIGAHTARWNTGALGIALLGCYDSSDCAPGQTPSTAALDSIAELATWTASRRVFDPRQAETFINVYGDPPLTLQRLAGHRDYRQYIGGQWYNATACPGDILYSHLATLRNTAWSRLPDDDVRFVSHSTPAILWPGQTVSVSFELRNAGKAPWTPDTVRLGYRWLDEAGNTIAQETTAGSLSGAVPFAGSLALTATLTAPPTPGTWTLRWDLYRPGAGWFADLSSASRPLEMRVRLIDASNLTQRLFLPVIIRPE